MAYLLIHLMDELLNRMYPRQVPLSESVLFLVRVLLGGYVRVYWYDSMSSTNSARLGSEVADGCSFSELVRGRGELLLEERGETMTSPCTWPCAGLKDTTKEVATVSPTHSQHSKTRYQARQDKTRQAAIQLVNQFNSIQPSRVFPFPDPTPGGMRPSLTFALQPRHRAVPSRGVSNLQTMSFISSSALVSAIPSQGQGQGHAPFVIPCACWNSAGPSEWRVHRSVAGRSPCRIRLSWSSKTACWRSS